jgi:hypothetical protein
MALRRGGAKHEDKSFVFLILNTPFLTFPRCAGEGVNRQRLSSSRQRRYNAMMLEKSLWA